MKLLQSKDHANHVRYSLALKGHEYGLASQRYYQLCCDAFIQLVYSAGLNLQY